MLQSLFEEAIRQHAGEIIADLVASKLEAEGVALGKRDRAKLLRALLQGEDDELRFRSWRFWDRRNVSVELTEEDLKVLEAEFEEIYEELPARIVSLVTRLSPEASRLIRRQYRKEIQEDRRALRRFRTKLHRTWKDGLRLLHLIVELATHIGQEAGTQALETYESADVLPSVLIRLHGRGIRICRETLVLLEAGYPEAAMTRWRALHELTVVALFIREYGEQCASDYVLHEAVQEFRVAKRYQEAAPLLGYPPLAADEFDSLRESAKHALAARGSQFGKDYGWAFEFLDGHPCNFAGLEQAVAMSHLRPFYSRASQDVHAGAAAFFPWLSRASQDTVLIGPSNAGLADPGQNMALSIGLLTTTFATLAPTLDSLVGCQVLVDLTNEVGAVLVGIQEEVDRRWKRDD